MTDNLPYSEHACLKAVKEKWDGPFERPIVFNRETNDLCVGDWAIRVHKLTKAGNISKQGGGVLMIKYCPLCGEKLIDEGD